MTCMLTEDEDGIQFYMHACEASHDNPADVEDEAAGGRQGGYVCEREGIIALT